VVAEPDGEGGIRMWVSTQVPFGVRDAVADSLGLPEEKVRVIAGDVGGGFGAKLMAYPEQSVIAAIAKKLDRAVRWFEYRTENMVAMTHGRGHVQHVALGATADGKLVGFEAEIIADAGAYAGLAPPQLVLTALLASGVYAIPRIRWNARCVYTNTAVMSAYRGAGRPEAIAMIERAMDMLAVELQMDPAELRRRNLISGPFPYTTATGLTYDTGDYARALDLALDAAGYDALRSEQRARRERGDNTQLGIGLSTYVEMTAVLTTTEFGAARAEAACGRHHLQRAGPRDCLRAAGGPTSRCADGGHSRRPIGYRCRRQGLWHVRVAVAADRGQRPARRVPRVDRAGDAGGGAAARSGRGRHSQV